MDGIGDMPVPAKQCFFRFILFCCVNVAPWLALPLNFIQFGKLRRNFCLQTSLILHAKEIFETDKSCHCNGMYAMYCV